MLQKKGYHLLTILAAFAALTVVSCTEELTTTIYEPGTEIVFGASTSWLNNVETRTEYSGFDEEGNSISGSSVYERIDWVEGNDRIQVLCAQAIDQDGQPNTSGTYQVGEPSPNGEKSEAAISLVSGSSSFFWGEGTHYFYALYPAAGTTSNYHDSEVTASDSSIESLTNKTAKITGAIPSSQPAVKVTVTDMDDDPDVDSYIYKPDMNLAYMYAAEKTGPVSSITLHFHPLVTAFEFSLKALDDEMTSYDLVSLTLSSTSTDLTGGFTSTLNLDADEVATVDKASSGLGREITLNLPSGTRLSKDVFSVFTFLALGVEQTDLKLTLTFVGGGTRSLALNKKLSGGGSEPITVGACKKAYFKLDIDSPEWRYFIGSLQNVAVGPSGGTGVFGPEFYSYRTNGIVTEPVPFRIRYWTSSSGWSYTAPDWCIMDVNLNGYVDETDLGVTFPPQVNSAPDTQHHNILADPTRAKSDYDLSTYNVATLTEGINRTTANCYVVRGSGTYKLPLVYGNGVVNGAVNEIAYHAKKTAAGPYISAEPHYLGYFKDHLDQDITTPYIAQQQAGKTLTAALVWSDVQGLITDVALTGSGQNAYLTFSVPAETIEQGNALVAVLADGKIAWSWHIWVTDEMGAPIPGFNGYTFSPLNLGWVEGKDYNYEERLCYVYAIQTVRNENGVYLRTTGEKYLWQWGEEFHAGPTNPFYQWGRKDPLRQADGSIPEGQQFNQFPGFKIYYPGPGFDIDRVKEDRAVSIGTAIQNPYTLYHQDPPANTNYAAVWCLTGEWNNWNSVYNGQHYNNYHDRVTKTIYDPCPVGYVLPNHDAFENLSTYSGNTFISSPLIWDGSRRGRYYESNPNLFFFAPGYLVDRGWISEYAKTANYWSATPATNWDDWVGWGMGISFNDETVSKWMQLHRRATGLSIRPVLDGSLLTVVSVGHDVNGQYTIDEGYWE